MKFLIVTLALVCAAFAQTDDDWVNYQMRFGKFYRSASEFADRRAKWENNFRHIQKHNEEYNQGLHTYTLGENQFADMSYEEFASVMLHPVQEYPTFTEVHKIDPSRSLKSAYDMRDHGLVNQIKDQGQCGSCWAFTATAAIEILVKSKSGKSVSLSEQQLIDCNKGFLIFGNQGCNGGTFPPTFDYTKTNGLQDDASYPYIEKDGTCKFDKNKVVADTKNTGGYTQVTSEAALIDAVARGNPVAIGIYASNNFMLYKSGVYTPAASENTSNPNHAILVIGYDVAGSSKYYKIKNSWSTKWGIDGYLHLQYGVSALNILKMAYYPKY